MSTKIRNGAIIIILDWLFVISLVIAPWALLAEVGILISFLVRKRPLKGVLLALGITIGTSAFLILARVLFSAIRQ